MTEQQNIEYKQSWRDEYLKWVCGFANSDGGVLYIGKDDNGKVVGVSEYKEPNVVRKIGYFSWFLAVLFMVMQSIKERNKG